MSNKTGKVFYEAGIELYPNGVINSFRATSPLAAPASRSLQAYRSIRSRFKRFLLRLQAIILILYFKAPVIYPEISDGSIADLIQTSTPAWPTCQALT